MIQLKKGFIVLLCFLIMLSGAALAPDPIEAADDSEIVYVPLPVHNAGFDEPVIDGKIPGWLAPNPADTGIGYSYEISEERSFTSSHSLKLIDQSTKVGDVNGKGLTFYSDGIEVVPGEKYTVTAQVYMEQQTGYKSLTSLGFRFYDEHNNHVGNLIERHHDENTGFPMNNWALADTPVAVAPAGAKYLKVVIFTTANARATSYYDNIQVFHEQLQLEPELPTGSVPNGGFEESLVDGKIPSWTTSVPGDGYTFEVSSAQSKSGNYSLKITDEVSAAGAAVALHSDYVEITPGDLYKVTAQVYMEPRADNSLTSLGYRYYDENKLEIAFHEKHHQTNDGFPVNEWKLADTPETIAPANAKYIRAVVFTTAFSRAISYYDDVTIWQEEGTVQEPIGFELKNPNFDQEPKVGKIPSWSSLFASTGSDYYYELSDAVSHSGDYSLRIFDQLRNQSVALISDPILVTPGDFYTGAGKLYVEQDSTASLSIRFYNEGGTQLNVGAPEIHYETSKNFPVQQWSDIVTHRVTAPDDAVHARLVIYTTSYAIADAYYDNMSIIHEVDPTPAQLSISAPSQLEADETFSVLLTASRVKELSSLNAELYYDSHLLEYVGYTPVGMFEGEETALEVSESQGNVTITAGLDAENPLTSSSDIVKLQFKVIGDRGQTWIVLSTETLMNNQYPLLVNQTVLSNVGEIGEGRLADIEFGDYEYVTAPIADTVGLFDGRAGFEDGQHVMYTTVKGIPPVFHVINLDTNTLIRSLPLEGGGDTWSHTVTPDGTVYIAAGDQLWAYSPETKTVEKVFTFSGESTFWALDHDEQGNVYIATGPGSKILQYDPVTKTGRDYGRLSSVGGSQYVRSVAYSNGFVYGGTSMSEIVRVDVETGEKVELAAPLEETGYVYDLNIVDDRLLIARFDTPQIRYVYDLENEEWLDIKIENSSSGLHLTKTSLEGKVYMPVAGEIKAFDVNTFELEDIGVPFGTGFRGADWVEIEGDPDLPGTSMVTMNFAGAYIYFNPQTNKTKTLPNFLPPAPSITHVFAKGNNGKIYITGMQASKAAEYDVFTGTNNMIPMGQAGSVAAYEDKVYFGVYPHAEFEQYDPASGLSPVKLFDIGAEQDRPINGIAADGKIFVGSIPDYGKLGGALMVYDPSADNPAESFKVHRNIVEDQSIISLAYKNGKIYGSTNINGGLTSQTFATEAKLFVWDVQQEEKISEFKLEIPGLFNPPSIGGLSIGPDGLLWGGVNGIVFAIDPASRALVKYKKLTEDGSWGQWGSFHAEWSDGILYMHLGRRLVAIDPVTMNHVHLADSEAFTIGEDGHLYFSPHEGVAPGSNRTLMYRIQIKDKTHPGKLNVNAPLSVEQGDEFEVSLYANQVNDLNRFTAQLSFDAEALQFISVEAAESFAGETASFTAAAEDGVVTIAAELAAANVLNGDEKAAIIRFKALKAANSSLIALQPESAVGFVNEEADYDAVKVQKSITIRIVSDETDPTNPTDPSGPSNPGTTTPEPSDEQERTVDEEGNQIITEDSLKINEDGKIAIEAASGSKAIKLPAKALLTNAAYSSVDLNAEQFKASISSDVLKQLGELVSAEELEQAHIVFSYDQLAAAAEQVLLNAVRSRNDAAITSISDIFDFSLSLVTNHNKSFELAQFNMPISISFKVNHGTARELLGIYFIADDGSLHYIGGTFAGDWITAELDHFSNYAVLEFNKTFSDVPTGHWAEQVIKTMAAKQIALGISNTEFAPNKSVTRAEFVAWIVRALRLEANGTNSFADVHDGQWFASAVTAAFEIGIVTGRSAAQFAPSETITREEMAVMIVRAYEHQQSVLAEAANKAEFADYGAISPWASSSIDIAYELGLVQGRGNHTFAPKGQLTRAEAIQVIANLLEQ